MAIFKCKMCGGTIEFEPGAGVGVCDSCGTKQTLPRLDDDRRANLYDRANHFRRNNEFDKAAGIYEKILTEDTADAEAYWSLVLCRYGIEYVEDPATKKRVPTVNRAQFTSIFDDDNYKSALQYADGYQRAIYEAEANAINEIQKGILAISQKEEPFDVFICYKETDANGRRTPDSVLANDLYHQLTQEGFKVFFARITLEDKLGTAYEPYIFAALNSAKVMVALGTKPEYFNAVWVKNEWSRYLALVKQSGGKKILIPAYKDMDPYDLPEEFSHLQAQDMSKLGFMQDLIRGIKKIAKADEPKAAVKETVVVGAGNANAAPLLKRAFMFLEDGEWAKADDFCEQVLNLDPENAQAYLGKLMAEQRVCRQADLADCERPFDGSSNYQKAVRFGGAELSAVLKRYIDHINERNENARLTGIYNSAVSEMDAADTESAFKAAAETFKTIPGFKNADSLSEQCLDKAEVCRKDAIYASARAKMTGDKTDGYEAALQEFSTISGWKDADEQICDCQRKIEEIKAKEEANRLEHERQAEQKRVAAEKAAKKQKKIIAITIPCAAAFIVFLIVLTTVIIPTAKKNTFYSFKGDNKLAAEEYLTSGETINAAISFLRAQEPLLASSIFDFASVLKVRDYGNAAIAQDGTHYLRSDNDRCGLDETDISKIVAFLPRADGFSGIDADGRVIAADYIGDEIDGFYFDAEDTVNSWNVKDFIAMYRNYYALTKDGFIISYIDDGREEDAIKGFENWKNITSIQAYEHDSFISALDENGKVFVAYADSQKHFNIDDWPSVSKVVYSYANTSLLAGITKENKIVLAYSEKESEEEINKDICLYDDVVDIVDMEPYLAVLHEDGTVSIDSMMNKTLLSNDGYYSERDKYYKQAKNKIKKWNGIVSIVPGSGGLFGIKYDGTVRYVSWDLAYENSKYYYVPHSEIVSAVKEWKDIVYIATALDNNSLHNYSWAYAVGLKADGKLVSTGNGEYYHQRDAYGWSSGSLDYGTYNDVSSWKLW